MRIITILLPTLLLSCSSADIVGDTETELELEPNEAVRVAGSSAEGSLEAGVIVSSASPRYMSSCRSQPEEDLEMVVSQLVDGYALVSFAGAESLGGEELRVAVPNGSLAIPATGYRVVSSEGVADTEGRRPEVVWVAEPSEARFFRDDGSEAVAVGPSSSRPEGFAFAYLTPEGRWVIGGFVGGLETGSRSALFPAGFSIDALSRLVAERRRDAEAL